MNNVDFEKLVFSYIDKNGIPYSKHAIISLIHTKNTYNEVYLSNGINHNLQTPEYTIKILLPFPITSEVMEYLVLKYIKETTGIHFDDVNQLLKSQTLNGVPFILILNEYEQIKKLSLAKKIIPGSLILRSDYNNIGIESLGKIEHIKGDFGICDSPIEDLGNLTIVDGDFWITKYDNYLKLKSLSPLVEVKGSLVINDTNIISLETVEKIKGNLNLRKSSIKNLGSLKFIGGNFLGPKSIYKDYDFSNITIKGKIKLYKN